MGYKMHSKLLININQQRNCGQNKLALNRYGSILSIAKNVGIFTDCMVDDELMPLIKNKVFEIATKTTNTLYLSGTLSNHMITCLKLMVSAEQRKINILYNDHEETQNEDIHDMEQELYRLTKDGLKMLSIENSMNGDSLDQLLTERIISKVPTLRIAYSSGCLDSILRYKSQQYSANKKVSQRLQIVFALNDLKRYKLAQAQLTLDPADIVSDVHAFRNKSLFKKELIKLSSYYKSVDFVCNGNTAPFYYKCEYSQCGQLFTDCELYRLHILDHAENTKIPNRVCRNCGKLNKSLANHNNHLLIH